MKKYFSFWEQVEDDLIDQREIMSTNKYYISTDLGRVYYKEIPEDVYKTTEEVGEYTGTPVGACWIKYDGKLCKLFNTQNDLQVIQIGYE